MYSKNDKSKYSFRCDRPLTNFKVNLTDTYLSTTQISISLQNTGTEKWPIGTMLKSHDNNIISFKNIIINPGYEIAPNGRTMSKIPLIFPGDIEPGDYCVVVDVVLGTGEIIGDFFFGVFINDKKNINNNQINFKINNNQLIPPEKKIENKANRIVNDKPKEKENIDLAVEIERLKKKNIQLKNAFELLKKNSEDRYNRILKEFREVYDEKEELLKQFEKNELVKEKEDLLNEIYLFHQEKNVKEEEMNHQIQNLIQEKNRLILLLNDEKKKVAELKKKNEDEVADLVFKKTKQEEENQKIINDLYGHIEVLEVQKAELESENAKLKDKNKKHLNEFVKQKAALTKENTELKNTIEIMKQNEQKNNELKFQLEKQKLMKKDFHINKVNDFSFIKSEQNTKNFNKEKLFINNTNPFEIDNKIVYQKNKIFGKLEVISEVNIQIDKNKENKENENVQGDLNEELNKKEIINDNTNNKEQQQINHKKELTNEEIQRIFDNLEKKFKVSSIFREEEIIKCIIDGNGVEDKIQDLLFH